MEATTTAREPLAKVTAPEPVAKVKTSAVGEVVGSSSSLLQAMTHPAVSQDLVGQREVIEDPLTTDTKRFMVFEIGLDHISIVSHAEVPDIPTQSGNDYVSLSHAEGVVIFTITIKMMTRFSQHFQEKLMQEECVC